MQAIVSSGKDGSLPTVSVEFVGITLASLRRHTFAHVKDADYQDLPAEVRAVLAELWTRGVITSIWTEGNKLTVVIGGTRAPRSPEEQRLLVAELLRSQGLAATAQEDSSAG